MFAEDEGGIPGGGIEALACMMNMLGADLERTQDGMGRLVTEADEVLQGVFERLGVLHARVSRIETACGLPPWQPPDEEEGQDEAPEPMSARTVDENGAGWPEEAASPGARRRRRGGKAAARRCCRGHPLEADEECQEDAPPRRCNFCDCNKQTTYHCSSGCYFHACAECVLGADANVCEPESAEQGEPDARVEELPDDLDAPIMPEDLPPRPFARTAAEGAAQKRLSSRSPSAASEEEDGSFCGRTPPAHTPSTAVPDDEDISMNHTGSELACEVPENVKSKFGRPPLMSPRPPSAGGAAQGSAAKGMKKRLDDLENEVRELSLRLSATQSLGELNNRSTLSEDCKSQLQGASKALEADVRSHAEELLNATRDECHEVMSHLAQELQNEVQAMSDPKRVLAMMQQLEEQGGAQAPLPIGAQTNKIAELRKEVNSTVASLRNDIQKNADSLRAELSSIVAAPVRDLRKDLEARVGQDAASARKLYAQSTDLAKVRQDLAGDILVLSGDIQRLKEGPTRGFSGTLSDNTSDFARSLPAALTSPSNARPPLLASDVSRGRLRPRTPSLSSTRSRKGDLMSNSDADGGSSDCLNGMVRAMTAIARVMGFLRDGNSKLGEGDWEWSRIGDRFEQAWTSQTKELWQLGMPLKPNIIDFLRSSLKSGLARDAARNLPDKREGARLAERLASGLTPARFDSADSAVRQLSQYTSLQSQDAAAIAAGAEPDKRAFAGLEALRQMRRQRNE